MFLNNQMQKKVILININNIYDLGKNLYLLSLLTGEQKKNELINLFHFTVNLLDNLMRTFELGSVYVNVQQLSNKLTSCIELEQDIIDTQTVQQINQAALELDFLLKNNFNYQTTFMPTPKGAYRLDVLLHLPYCLFPKCLLEVLPNSEYDVIEFGKAFAFELPTSCAFNLMRIFEAVIIRYYNVVSKVQEHTIKNIGGYIDALEKIEYKDKDNGLIDILKSIKNTYRNPIIHPEVNMTMGDVIRLYGVVYAAIDLMFNIIIDNNNPHLKNN
jgi:hypothetical protein